MSVNGFDSTESIDVVASLLKKYLREIPDIPLFTHALDSEVCFHYFGKRYLSIY